MERLLQYSLFVALSTLVTCLTLVFANKKYAKSIFLSFIFVLVHFGLLSQLFYLAEISLRPSPLYLSLYWLLVLAASVPCISHFSRKLKAVIVLRKTFHLIVLLLFAPPIILRQNLEFIAAAGVTVLCAMIVLETVRVGKIHPKISASLNKFMSPLLDKKDSKRTLVTSHMELLVASIAAVWVNQAFPKSPFTWTESSRFLLCGLLTVGVGDSAAAIGGLNFGKPIKLPLSDKSLQGLLSFIASVLLALHFVSIVDAAAIIATIASALTEAYVHKFDNIALPFVFAATMLLCRTYLDLHM